MLARYSQQCERASGFAKKSVSVKDPTGDRAAVVNRWCAGLNRSPQKTAAQRSIRALGRAIGTRADDVVRKVGAIVVSASGAVPCPGQMRTRPR
jgi:hypothetical protein